MVAPAAAYHALLGESSMNCTHFLLGLPRCARTMTIRFVAATLAIGGPVHAAPVGEPLTPVISVLSSLEGQSNPGQPAVSADASGNFTVGWYPSRSSRQRFLLRRFNAAGSPLGDQYQITNQSLQTGETGAAPLFSIATNRRGDQVVAWITPSVGTDATIVAQVFRADGTARTGAFEVGQTPPRNEGSGVFQNAQLKPPSVAINDDGDVMIAWASDRNSTVLADPIWQGFLLIGLFRIEEQVLARGYSIDGVPYGDAQIVDRRVSVLPSVTGGSVLRYINDTVQVSSGPNGTFAVGYRIDRAALTRGQPSLLSPFRARILGATARPHGPVLVLNTVLDGQLLVGSPDFRISSAANGDLMLAWAAENPASRRSGGLDQTIYLGRYSALGLPKGLPARVGTRNVPATGLDTALFVKPIPSGGNVVAWASGTDSGEAVGIRRGFARYFAADESPLSPAFIVSETSLRIQNDISIDTDAVGNLIAASTGRDVEGIFARVFAGP